MSFSVMKTTLELALSVCLSVCLSQEYQESPRVKSHHKSHKCYLLFCPFIHSSHYFQSIMNQEFFKCYEARVFKVFYKSSVFLSCLLGIMRLFCVQLNKLFWFSVEHLILVFNQLRSTINWVQQSTGFNNQLRLRSTSD